MTQNSEIKQLLITTLKPYKEKVERALSKVIEELDKKNTIRDAVEYAISTGGKRLRPALVYIIGEALGSKEDLSYAAISVEFFHTASLIADDLPCMDNDDLRRGKPTLHKQFSEATALLAGFSLFSAGFETIVKTPSPSDAITKKATLHAAKLNGIAHLIQGQYLDLIPADLSIKGIEEIITKKTCSLFELAFLYGWLFGGGDPSQEEGVRKAAFHFGAAFQILDDIDDRKKDLEAQRKANFALLFGSQSALKAVQEHVKRFIETIQKLKISCTPLIQLAKGMEELAVSLIMNEPTV